MGIFKRVNKQVFVIQRDKKKYQNFLCPVNHLNKRNLPSATLVSTEIETDFRFIFPLRKFSFVLTPWNLHQPNEKVAQNASERIRTRTANGEFGTPPDINLVHQAWEDLLANEVRGRGRRPIYHDVCGLWHDLGWTNDANRVLLSGVARESIIYQRVSRYL